MLFLRVFTVVCLVVATVCSLLAFAPLASVYEILNFADIILCLYIIYDMLNVKRQHKNEENTFEIQANYRLLPKCCYQIDEEEEEVKPKPRRQQLTILYSPISVSL
jgi:hypothetical protein